MQSNTHYSYKQLHCIYNIVVRLLSVCGFEIFYFGINHNNNFTLTLVLILAGNNLHHQ
jgi:hypothetical protein